jgi:hypothetical protein
MDGELEPLYEADGARYVPSPFTRSPWTPDAQHGGAPAALLVGAIEQHGDGELPSQLLRFTVDLLRPIPVTPMRVETTTVRPGRRVSVIAAALLDGDDAVARMTALLVRDADVQVPDDVPQPDDGVPASSPAESGPADYEWPYEAFHTHGCEVRFARGGLLQPGPSFAWIRLRHPVLAGTVPSPMQRVAAACDSGNGVSSVLPFESWLFVNPDLNANVHRHPRGEWIGLDAQTLLGDRGAGTAVCQIYDEQGRIGESTQSLLVEPR